MATATLTTITPVHVGSGQKLLRNFDFVAKDEKVGFIDLEKVVNIIGVDQIAQLTTVIEQKKSLMDYLQNGRGLKNIQLEDICSRIAVNRAAQSRANELKELYHTSLKGACIPGSSLKGAIKTALWARACTVDFLNELTINDFKNRKGKWDSEKIDQKLFGNNPNEKTTRFLKVGDIHFKDVQTCIYEVGIYNKHHDDEWRFKENQFFLAECLPDNAVASFELILDKKWFEKNTEYYPNNWNSKTKEAINKSTLDFLKQLNTYTLKMIDTEIKELKEANFENRTGFYQNEGTEMLDWLDKVYRQAEKIDHESQPAAVIRVGGNSGWSFMTGSWVKDVPETVLDDDSYLSIRKTVQRGKSYNDDLWPKTRKMITGEGIPLGFVKISLAS